MLEAHRTPDRPVASAGVRTQVAIIGAGPAGLVLGALLQARGIDAVVLEARSREYVERRVRAGVLEQGTVDLLTELGVAGRLHREGLVHEGIELRFGGAGHRIALAALTGGRTITIYGQQEVVKDLIAARLDAGLALRFGVEDVRVEGVEGDAPAVRWRDGGGEQRLDCDVVAGCDGFHGVCRHRLPAAAARVFEREWPFAWLGILAQAPPVSDELIYCLSEHGFALASARSPSISRLYLQVAPDTGVEAWPEERIWDELERRLGESPPRGRLLERGVTPMRSYVREPLRHGRLFLAGDAAHIVPPTGAKGLNLAVADVRVLAAALERWYANGDESGLDAYSDVCLRRVWGVQFFSSWMTRMLHPAADGDPFALRLQLAELGYVCSSQAAARSLAENYVGLPYET
ncbi:MAG: p-hydroxybenzoate 3-monooxygenase [Solirubrobacteraceae bacterium]|nr:p-hydroxybenzoate 3-monooxygenase [Solirubrobacteraceae bacterium]